jgi:hypothetical protein
MNVNDLIKHLQDLVKQDSDIGQMFIRVIEQSEYENLDGKIEGDSKPNYWIDLKKQILVCPMPTGSMPSDPNHKGEIVFVGEE